MHLELELKQIDRTACLGFKKIGGMARLCGNSALTLVQSILALSVQVRGTLLDLTASLLIRRITYRDAANNVSTETGANLFLNAGCVNAYCYRGIFGDR